MLKHIIIFLLLVQGCFSQLDCTNDGCVKWTLKPVAYNDNITTVINPTISLRGYLLLPIPFPTGYSATVSITKYHNVYLDLDRKNFYKFQKVTGTIEIYNIGITEQYNSELTYYFVSPNGEERYKKTIKFTEMPFACNNSQFNSEYKQCVDWGGARSRAYGEIIHIEQVVPLTEDIGEWQLETQYVSKYETIDTEIKYNIKGIFLVCLCIIITGLLMTITILFLKKKGWIKENFKYDKDSKE